MTIKEECKIANYNLKSAIFLLLGILSVIGQADELHCGPGQSYSQIQAAIEDADHGDTVIVHPATYYENIDFLGKAITVTSLDPNDPCTVAETIIDGSMPADPNYASVVTFKSGENNDSVLTGFTITGGTGSWLVVSWEFKGMRWNLCGGGVVCYNMSEPTISKNIFRNNLAGQGGGVYIYGDPVDPCYPSNPPNHLAPVISENLFEYNQAITDHGFDPPDEHYICNDHGDGGAIVAFQGVDAIINNNAILSNHADHYGGGVHIRQWSNGQIENNQVAGNDSELGAGIHITYTSSPTVCDNLIESNEAGGLGGGGIYVYYYSDPLIERNTITMNDSTNGSGIGVFWNSTATIVNNLIYSNKSGAAIRMVDSAPLIRRNTITKNGGGGIICYNSTPSIKNNILSSNGTGWGIVAQSGSAPIVCYNNVWDHSAGNYGYEITDQTGINGNISVSPDFVDAINDNYHLNYNSECINAGDPCYVLQEGETDYYGESRFLGQYVDMGADEVWPVWNITAGWQYLTIQDAIDDADPCEAATVILTKGRHTGDGNRDISFAGKAICLTSIDPNDPGIVAATIIDSQGTAMERHRAFVFNNTGEEPDTIIDGFTITHGTGYRGGGIYCFGSSPTIKNCNFIGNVSRDQGGGIYCGYYSNPVITNCLFSENSFDPTGYGGGIYCYESSPTVVDCMFLNNSAIGSGRHGGGICCWGSASGGSNALVVNCVFAGNTADHRGGALYAYWSSPVFINCTVIGNWALEGGGIGSFSRDYIPELTANPVLINCILRNNRSYYGPEGALINTRSVWEWGEHAEMTISYCNIEGGQDAIFVDERYTPPWPACVLHWEAGNIDVDPCFVDPGYWDSNGTPSDPCDDYFVPGDYHIKPGSLCAEVGDNSAVPGDITTDIDGEDRIVGGIVDMGADELFDPNADINSDGRVDMVDLGLLLDDWLAEGQGWDLAPPEDFIDLRDLAVLSQWWLWQGHW